MRYIDCLTCGGGRIAYMFPDGCPHCKGVNRLLAMEDEEIQAVIKTLSLVKDGKHWAPLRMQPIWEALVSELEKRRIKRTLEADADSASMEELEAAAEILRREHKKGE